MTLRPLIAGNWKMNGLMASAAELQGIIAGARTLPDIDLMICPPATLLASFAAVTRGTPVALGGQDCYALAAGAYTGDISAEMLRDAGAVAVIVGHSERRHYHHETDADIRAKARAAHRAGLLAIVCIGESRDQRDAGSTRAVLSGQLEGSLPDSAESLVIAYEPIWAIGSGQTPNAADVGAIHQFIRQQLCARFGEDGNGVRILYGGSVKPANAASLLAAAEVNGALIGGASLKAAEFLAIASACG
jgi:triosephosphate isomerase